MTIDHGDARIDIAIVGAGAAGLFAAIHAARAAPDLRVVAFDGAKKLGAKILVAGGGRCNVTHFAVSERDYCGAPSHLVRRVLGAYGVEETVDFFGAEGVELKREETGKLFPTTDKARTVLDALLTAAQRSGVDLRHPCSVDGIDRRADGFVLALGEQSVTARRVIVAVGGKSLPKSGSDGRGYALATSLGHTLTPRIEPALVPLTLPKDAWLTRLSGIAVDDVVDVVLSTGRSLWSTRGAVLLTHFGVSGPAILDASRHWIHAHADNAEAALRINFVPSHSRQSLEELLKATKGKSVLAALHGLLPERFLRESCAEAQVDPTVGAQQITRAQRSALCDLLAACVLPINGTRGFDTAETTAGGIPLTEVAIETMESVRCPGLHLCGEVLDVDARIGGFSFQWAWSSGFVAGTAAAAAVRSPINLG